MLWSTSLSSDSSTCVSHFISEMIFDRVINSTPVAVWCLKPLVWPRNHEHKVVLSVLYLTFFDSTQQNWSTIWLLDWFPKSPASSTRPQFLRNEIPTFQAQCISCASRNKIAKTIGPMVGHHPTLTDKHPKTFLFSREYRERERDWSSGWIEFVWAFTATYVSLPIVHHHHSHNHYCQLSHSLQCNEHINVLVALTFLALLIPSFHSWQHYIVQKTVQP